MKSVIVALGLAAVAAPAVAQHAGHDMSKAHAMQCAAVPNGAVDSLFKQFDDAWATKNPDAVTSLFAKDAVLLATVSNKPRTTPAEIRDYFVSFLKNNPDATIDSSTVRVGCNNVTRMGTWSVAMKNGETGAESTVKARYTFVYVPEGNTWKIAHLHSSLMPETGGK